MNKRVNAFASLSEDPPVFTTKTRTDKPVPTATIDRIAAENNFPSRQAKAPATPKRKPRTYRTGRNQSLGIKATVETVERFYKAADAKGVPLGELLKQALDALERVGESR
jgi:hypothetical protein